MFGFGMLNLQRCQNCTATLAFQHLDHRRTAILNCRKQSITRFDRWSMSATAMFQQLSSFCRVTSLESEGT
jgi:uncharacterized paraquat-inducible protein A